MKAFAFVALLFAGCVVNNPTQPTQPMPPTPLAKPMVAKGFTPNKSVTYPEQSRRLIWDAPTNEGIIFDVQSSTDLVNWKVEEWDLRAFEWRFWLTGQYRFFRVGSRWEVSQ